MLSNNTQKINITLTFPATTTSNLTVKNNFNISACTLNTNYDKKSTELTYSHSRQSVTFSPTQHFHTCRNINASFVKEQRGGKNNCRKTAVVETHQICRKHEKTTKNENLTFCTYKKKIMELCKITLMPVCK
jgi:hypothetical protein